MADNAYLVSVKDAKGMLTGFSHCILCNAEFGSRPNDPNELAIIFAVHFAQVHGNASARKSEISQT
jgi:hypothetical protein